MILLAQGKKQAEIAKALGRSSSTISRELKRHALKATVQRTHKQLFEASSK